MSPMKEEAVKERRDPGVGAPKEDLRVRGKKTRSVIQRGVEGATGNQGA